MTWRDKMDAKECVTELQELADKKVELVKIATERDFALDDTDVHLVEMTMAMRCIEIFGEYFDVDEKHINDFIGGTRHGRVEE